jgi:hypothetical protein
MTRLRLGLAFCLLLAACTAQDPAGRDGTTSIAVTVATAPGSTGTTGAGDGGMTCWTAPIETAPGQIALLDETEEMGLEEPLLGLYGHVAAFGQVNDDPFADLVVGTFGDRDPEEYQERGAEGPAPDRLLISQPGLVLEPDWSNEMGRTSGAAFADFDGDGDSDLLLVRHAGRDGDFPVPTRLFENVDGSLQANSEPLPADFRGRTPAVADFDGDGLLDVYVSEDNSGETGGLLLRNDGELRFSDATGGSGLEGVLSLGATAGHLNDDLLPDLATSTAVFVNRGGMTFEEVTPEGYQAVPIGEEDDPAGVAIGDLDRDGATDLVVGQHYRATVEFDSEVAVRIFLGDGAGTPSFTEVTEASGSTPLPTLAPHVDLADIDNDGWPDVVTTASAGDGKAPAILRNTGNPDLAFETSPGLGSDQYWIGAPVADVDHDGRLDLFAVEWEPSLPSLMFMNRGETGHWLEVSVDRPGDGIGSVVTVTTEQGEVIGREQIWVGGGYSTGVLPYAHFGLGPETSVAVTITLPDGTTEELPQVAADQHIRWPGGC